MNKKISLGIAIGLIALAAAATFIITYNYSLTVFNGKLSDVAERESVYARLSELDKYIRANYIGEIKEDAVMDEILRGYIEGIDDEYATYYTPSEYSEISDKAEGINVGLGFEFEKESSGYIKVTKIISGGPADDIGIIEGDIITAVNNKDVIAYEKGYEEAVSLLNCSEGTKIKLHIRRINNVGYSEFFSVDLVAEVIEIISVNGRIIEETEGHKVGYVKIDTFNEKTPAQFQKLVNDLISRGADSLIFDIRDNLGGEMTSLESVLDFIIGAGDIVYATYKDKEEVVIKTTEADKITMPIAVLVNKNTASASELFAFALREHSNAQIIGEQTFGKGVMQYTHKLSNGGAIRLTVANLKTSESGDYNKIGIKPHYDIKIPEGIDISTLSNEDSLNYDTQLIKALEVVQTLK